LIDAMTADIADTGQPYTLDQLRVDGGMVANDWLVQFLADMLSVDVVRPTITETTALGAAYLAGLQAGIFKDLDDISAKWHQQAKFTPNMEDAQRTYLYDGWQKAVKSALS
jgi:glycerol kinase